MGGSDDAMATAAASLASTPPVTSSTPSATVKVGVGTALAGSVSSSLASGDAETQALFCRLAFSLDELRYLYPDEPTGSETPPQETLERLTATGLKERYPEGAPQKVLSALGVAGASPNLVRQVVQAVADRQEPEPPTPPAGTRE